MFTLPNILTMARIVVIVPLVASFYVEGEAARWAAFWMFAFAAVTDFFDGYLARRQNQVSAFGRFLDPIADKLLVAAVLLMLAAFDRMSLWALPAAVIILMREILVSGLREFLAEARVGLPVTKLAKWKTTFQLIALPMLLVGEAGDDVLGILFGLDTLLPITLIAEISLWIAAAMTLITGYDYLRAGLRHMRAVDAGEEPAE